MIIISDLLTVFETLFLVLIILFLSFYFTKKIGGGFGGIGLSKNIRIIDRLPLGQSEALYIIKLSETFYLIGVTQSGINLLKEIPKEEAYLINEGSKEGRVPQSFASILLERIKTKK